MNYARIPWSVDAEKGLSNALPGDALSYVRDEVHAGEAALWSVNNGDTFFVVRIENRELVIVAIEGKNFVEVAREICLRAFDKGLSVRAHGPTPAILKWWSRVIPISKKCEYILRVEHHGR